MVRIAIVSLYNITLVITRGNVPTRKFLVCEINGWLWWRQMFLYITLNVQGWASLTNSFSWTSIGVRTWMINYIIVWQWLMIISIIITLDVTWHFTVDTCHVCEFVPQIVVFLICYIVIHFSLMIYASVFIHIITLAQVASLKWQMSRLIAVCHGYHILVAMCPDIELWIIIFLLYVDVKARC